MKLKYKIVTYSPEGLDEELLNKEKDGVKYLSKKAFDKAAEDGLEYRIVGKTRLKEAEEDDEKVLTVGEKRYLLEECRLTRLVGYIPVGDGSFVEYRKSVLLLVILLTAVFALAVFGLVKKNEKPPEAILRPEYDITELDTYMTPIEEPYKNVLFLTLPTGEVEFKDPFLNYENELLRADGKEYDEEVYSGTIHITTYLLLDGKEYLIFDDSENLTEGRMGEKDIDFDQKTTELPTGIHAGRLVLDYGTLGQIDRPMTVLISQANGGVMDVSFVPEVSVNRSTGEITLSYTSGSAATDDVVVQLILDSGDQSYLLAESGIITPGHSLSRMKLREGASDRFLSGGYNGRLRLNFYRKDTEEAMNDVNTDIEVKIWIH